MLITITGLPYAGKTTLRKKLVEKFDLKVVSVDELNDQFGVPKNQNEWDSVYKKAYTQLKNYLHDGYSVVFDGGSLLRNDRIVQEQIATDAGTETMLIYVKASLATIKERRSNNFKTGQRKHVTDELFTMALGMFEEPTTEENPIIYTTEIDADSWIDTHITKKITNN